MRIIKTQQDLVILRRVGALPAALLDQVEDYFNQLSVELEDEAESQFRLGANGYIVLLEAGKKSSCTRPATLTTTCSSSV